MSLLNTVETYFGDGMNPVTVDAMIAYITYQDARGIPVAEHEFAAVAKEDPEFLMDVIDAYIMRQAYHAIEFPKFPDMLD